MAKLQVKNLSKKYRKLAKTRNTFFSAGLGSKRETEWIETSALKGVSFDVDENEFVCIIGPSGCGKTTLLKIIDGLIRYDEGEILLDGNVVTGPGPDKGMVFQTFNLFPWKNVWDNVLFGLELQNVPATMKNQRAEKYINLVGLNGFEKHYPHELSGGMQQRVGLARALVLDPKVLLMDEPFGSVDAQTRVFLQDELLKIWDQAKKTVVFVTHSIDEAAYLADRIIVLSRPPGTVREIVKVSLEGHRWEYDARSEPEFVKMRAHIWDVLKEETNLMMKDRAMTFD